MTHNVIFGVSNHLVLGDAIIVLMVVLAGAMLWLTRADRRTMSATESRGEEPARSTEAPAASRRAGIPRVTAYSAALVGLLLASTALLIYSWRAQHPSGLMSIDDSLYAMLAVLDWRALAEHGLSGLVGALTSNDPNAPLVPLLAAPLTARNSMSTATVLVEIPFLWLLIVSSNSIYRRVTGPQAAFVATVVTAFLPGVLIYSRLLHFAVPLTAVLTAALAALLASRRLTSWKWAIVFGTLTGLALLTRTVAVAMVPGLVLAAVVLAVHHSPVRVWLPNLAAALVAAAAVAGPWYLANFSAVFDRLIGLGVAGSSVLNAHTATWIMRPAQIVGQDFFIPMSIVGAVIVVAAVARWWSRRRATPRPPTALVVAIAVTVGWYFASLLSGNNSGTAFTLPLAPLLVALVLHIANQLGRRQAAVSGAIALALVTVNLVAAVIPLGHVGVGDVVGVGDFGIVDGRSASDAQIESALGTRDATVSDPAGLGLALQRANCAIASRAKDGPILLTRSDALLGGVVYCALGVYRMHASMYGPGCAPTDGACVARVIDLYGFPTVITGDAAAPYPGSMPEDVVLPALANYRMIEEIRLAPGVVVHIWARSR